ncbi:GILT-like protein 1 [Culicoides brevitarsis]|uniref:GILT-like protein 1 n=1 Tax=Culicoides brevitarsis TaxID=469753 RepID=UPI00307B16E6
MSLINKMFVFLAFFALSTIHAEKPQVHVVFEALCPASINFVETNLKSNYSPVLKDHVDITFIPFGKAREVPEPEKFSCQHGPEECQLNMMMSCALYFLKEQPKQVDFVVCAMKLRENWMECAKKVKILPENVLKCYNGTSMGEELQVKAMQLQNEVLGGFPKGVPTIVVDRKPDDYLTRLAFEDLRKALCELFHEKTDTKWTQELIDYCK